MLNTHRTHAQASRSAYQNPEFAASYLVRTGQPLPVDLQEDLMAQGIIVDEFIESLSEPLDNSAELGFQFN